MARVSAATAFLTIAILIALHCHVVTLIWSRETIEAVRFKEVSGKGSRYPMPAVLRTQAGSQANALVLEDGRPLPWRAASMQDVIANGAGRYVFTGKNLWMSASDDTDPRSNGRRYKLAFPLPVPPWLQWLAHALAAVFLTTAALDPAFRRFTAGLGRTAGRFLGSKQGGWALAVTLVAARLLLVSRDEVIVSGYDPAELVSLADHWYYGASVWSMTRLPVYPLFIACCDGLALRLRLGIELAQASMFALLLLGCLGCKVSRPASFAVFASMLFCPQTADWNNHCISDSLYGPMMIGASGLALLCAATGNRWFASGCGILLGLLMNLRQEAIGTVGCALLLALVAAWNPRLSGNSGWPRIARPWNALLLLGTWLVVDAGFQAAFHFKTGVWSRSRLSTPGISALMTNWYRIPREGPALRYFVVTEPARERAYQLSRILAGYRHAYEKPESKEWWAQMTGHREISADNLLWTTLAEFRIDGAHDLVAGEQLMRQAGEQIAGGLRDAAQSVYVSSVFPLNEAAAAILAREWWPLVEESWRTAFNPPPMTVLAPRPDSGPRPDDRLTDLFNRLTNRDPALAQLVDSRGCARPVWISQVWAAIHRSQTFLIALLALVAGSGAAGLLISRGVARDWKAPPIPRPIAPLLIVGYVAGSKIAIASIAGIYFPVVPRYMLPLNLTVIPALVLLLDLLIAWRRGQNCCDPAGADA